MTYLRLADVADYLGYPDPKDVSRLWPTWAAKYGLRVYRRDATRGGKRHVVLFKRADLDAMVETHWRVA